MESEVVQSQRKGRKRKVKNVQSVETGGEVKKRSISTRSTALLGSYVRKEFEGIGILLGKVVNCDKGLYRIDYQDGYSEDLGNDEVRDVLIGDADFDNELLFKKKELEELILTKYANGSKGKLGNAVEMVNTDGGEAKASLLGVSSNLATGRHQNSGAPLDSVDADHDFFTNSCNYVSGGPLSYGAGSFVTPPVLPPSTGNIGVPDACVADLLSVYSFLRSFSIPLFLCPFGLDDFVGSLNCSVQNTLLDAIHVALMRCLRRHFETLSSEGSELASKCLRCVDWSLIDSLTWTVFLVRYLLTMGYKEGHRWEGFYSDCLQKDYYNLPAGSKLKILQILCDAALDSAEIRAEIDMREVPEVVTTDGVMVAASEGGPRRVHPRSSKTSACNDQEAMEIKNDEQKRQLSCNATSMDYKNTAKVSGADDQDGNGYECRLCGMDGTLLCCDSCPSVYHSRCIGVSKTSIPEGEWYCPECTINKADSTISKGSLRGAELFGVDPFEQVFLGSCNHLLVIKMSTNSDPCIRYYHQYDIPTVLRALHSSRQHITVYSGLCKAILEYWEIPTDVLSLTEKFKAEDCNYKGTSFKAQSYINHYVHGDYAASAAANLTILLSAENQASESHANISLQVKAFSSAPLWFFWADSEKKLVEVPREKCGWCLSCQAPSLSKRGCLLNAAASDAIRGTMKRLSVVRPRQDGEKGLSSIATYLIFLEESLHGLTVGPFQSPRYRKKWCKKVEQAITCNAIKSLLLEVEENVRVVAFTREWVKFVDEWSVESPVNQNITSAVVSSQKRVPVGRRDRKQGAMLLEFTANKGQDKSKDFIWWRGGIMSKLILQRGIIPCSMAKKSARQGGSRKIPSVSYTEGAEIPKRSRRISWRAAVEMSRNTSQLAAQIRYLDIHVRWGDLLRPDKSTLEGKGSEAGASVFRNAFICDRRYVESETQYALEFGNQKDLPTRIKKNVIEVERRKAGKQIYWFIEKRVPLYMIREFEENMAKVTFPPAEKVVNELSELQRRQLKASRKAIFSYLLRRRDNMEMCRCASCQLDLLIGNGVKCSKCKGYCHMQCTVKSTLHVNEEVKLVTCKQCDLTEAVTKNENCDVTQTSCLHVKEAQNALTEAPEYMTSLQTEEPQNVLTVSRGGRKSASSMRSAVNETVDQSYEKTLSRNASSWNLERSKLCSWGLIWKKKNCEETGFGFRLKNILHKGNPNSSLVRCDLCKKPYDSDLMYISCETCNKWYHADALELDESRIFELLGFKCCKCRRIKSPVCPYSDPVEKAASVGRNLRRRASKQTSSRLEDALVDIEAADPFGSLMSVKLVTDKESQEVNGECSSVFPLPRSHNFLAKKLLMHENDTVCVPVNTITVDLTSPLAENSVLPSVESSSCIGLGASKSDFENGVMLDNEVPNHEDMEFEPQTYFSFTDLVASNDGAQFDGVEPSRNMTGSLGKSSTVSQNNNPQQYGTGNRESLAPPVSIMPCRLCSLTEPSPDRSCEICGLWMHSHCSPVEESSEQGPWRCVNCREWR